MLIELSIRPRSTRIQTTSLGYHDRMMPAPCSRRRASSRPSVALDRRQVCTRTRVSTVDGPGAFVDLHHDPGATHGPSLDIRLDQVPAILGTTLEAVRWLIAQGAISTFQGPDGVVLASTRHVRSSTFGDLLTSNGSQPVRRSPSSSAGRSSDSVCSMRRPVRAIRSGLAHPTQPTHPGHGRAGG